MGDLTKITQAQLDSALTTTSEPSQRRLSEGESLALTLLVAQTAKRYPSQDLTDSIGEIMQDFEQLAMKYSLKKVSKALHALRLKPGQGFFPRPDEVAEEIERQRDSGLYRDNQREYELSEKRTRDGLNREQEIFGNWRLRWKESGMPLSEFLKKDDQDRENGTGFYAERSGAR